MFGYGQSDPKIGVERTGDAFAEDGADAAARDPARAFLDEVSERARVVAVRRAGRPGGRLALQRGGDRGVIENVRAGIEGRAKAIERS
jgi:hypothetical protein